MHLKKIQNCRICNNPHLIKVVDLGLQYTQGAFITKNCPSPPMRKIPTEFAICDTTKQTNACGAFQSLYTVPPEVLYYSYFYRSSVSNTMKNHLCGIADEILEVLEDKGEEFYPKLVLDIGCNDGFLLNCFDEEIKKIGIDPSNVAAQTKYKDIKIYNTTFPNEKIIRENGFNKFDVITSIACFYDIDDPIAFCQEIKKLLSKNGIWVLEVAYLSDMIKNLTYDSNCHEHVFCYSFSVLNYLFNKTGLKAFKIEQNDTNGGSLQVWVTHVENDNLDNKEYSQKVLDLRLKEFEDCLDEEKTYKEFNKRIYQHREQLIKILRQFKKENKIVHAYGMSTKLNNLLQFCDIKIRNDSSFEVIENGIKIIEIKESIKDFINGAADRDENKWGGQTLTGIPIMSEEESRKTADVYLVGPYHFEKEILQREKQTILNQNKTFIFPLPQIQIVDKNNYYKVVKNE